MPEILAEHGRFTRRWLPPGDTLTGVTSVVAAAALLSSSYTITKVALDDLPPLTIGFLRFTIAACVLGCWVRFRRYPGPEPADRRRLVLGGLLGITLYFTVENVGVDLATAADAALLVAAYPAVTALLEAVVFRRRPTVGAAAGIALSMVGVLLIVGYVPAGSGPHRRVGDVLLVVSGLVWALYNFATRSVVARHPAPVVLYHQVTAGAIGFLPLALLEHGQWPSTLVHPVATPAAIGSLALLCSILGLGLYAKGLRSLVPSTAVNLLNLVPLFGLAISMATLGERVTAVQALGGLVVIAGVVLNTRADATGPPDSGRRDAPVGTT